MSIEEEARVVAARLGVPDFVYCPAQATKGSGDREVSDGLLVAGDSGLVVQVKSRDPTAGAADSEQRAEAWIAKHAARAVRQGEGSRRTLVASVGQRFVSMRGYERELHGRADWPVVVVLDHPRIPSVTLPTRSDVMYVTFEDWNELHRRLRSTAAIIEYVQRAIALGRNLPLGGEHLRYQQIANADAAYAAQRRGTAPIVPLSRLTRSEEFAVDLFDDLVERVADATNKPWDEHNYLGVVEMLDRQPVLRRALIGKRMIDTFQHVRTTGTHQGFYVPNRSSDDRFAFFFDVDNSKAAPDYDERHVAEIAAYGYLRHVQARESGAPRSTRTLAVGVRHNESLGRRYAFALFEGDVLLDSDLRRMLETDHGLYSDQRSGMRLRSIGRNEPCPCNSGRKYKHCCLG